MCGQCQRWTPKIVGFKPHTALYLIQRFNNERYSEGPVYYYIVLYCIVM